MTQEKMTAKQFRKKYCKTPESNSKSFKQEKPYDTPKKQKSLVHYHGRPVRTKILFVNPTTKPRMTQRDKWFTRDCVAKYWEFKNQVRQQIEDFEFPECNYHVIFYVQMPKSWTKKKKKEMNMTPHQQKKRNDKDNLEKALLDALFEDDSHISDGRVSKIWAYEGRIVINVY